MKTWKVFLQKILAQKGIYVTKKLHPNDFTIVTRILQELIKDAKGVLHIGAHLGQEASFYEKCKVPVIWFEASPHIFPKLQENIKDYKNQRAILQLLGDQNDILVKFRISSNDGASSSIYDISPTENSLFTFEESIDLKMKRLDSIPETQQIKSLKHWVIDVQGAEIAVLKGAGDLINYCNSIFIEVKRTSTYIGGSTWSEIVTFLREKGFIYLWEVNAEDEDNIIFVRVQNRITEKENRL